MDMITRQFTKEISQKVQDALQVLASEMGVTIETAGASFDDVTIRLKLSIRKAQENGEKMFTCKESHEANAYAVAHGVKFEGDLLGSRWYNPKLGAVTVTDFKSNRPTYKYIITSPDGSHKKCPVSFFTLSETRQLVLPIVRDFVIWCTIDPDSDAVRESDVEIYDRVDETLSLLYTGEVADRFYRLIDYLAGKCSREVMTTIAHRAYTALVCKGIENANEVLTKYRKEIK